MAWPRQGCASIRVARRGRGLSAELACSADGSWPIDTNLATWVTTLAIKALAHQPGALTPEQRLTLREWLLGQQYRVEHPYTHAAPGGWAWTDLPGGVPDADDTPGALLALLASGTVDRRDAGCRAGGRAAGCSICKTATAASRPSAAAGARCPSTAARPDLTAHTLRAWSAWLPQLDERTKRRTRARFTAALAFLRRTQRDDGSWLPLWFGNEHAPDDENPALRHRARGHRAARVAASRLHNAADF